MMRARNAALLFGFCTITFLLSGCSINKMATRAVANALTGAGAGTVFTGDSDPRLVGDALPFAIKMYEALLDTQPDHQGLILTTGSLFVMYANAFVQGPAEMLPRTEYRERREERERARLLYLRGVGILRSGLDKKYPGFNEAGREGKLDAYLARLKKEDVPLLYWTVAATLSAYSLDPFNLELGMRIPELSAMIQRAYELDPDFNGGAIDDFYILFYGSLPPFLGGDKSKADIHFKLAVEKSGGMSAGPYISYAQAVSIPAQDYETFKEYLETALAVDPDANPSNRLVNIISQRKAQYLLDNASNYFLLDDDEDWDDEDWDDEDWGDE
ncbi:MAG: TRAP transporter TatT component family protein [Treponema sp.]|jgi:predicted anti-sigma-YlaC factor YlaD|nr:TRAP transporter TatT component family protein [Treponema sp.]